MAYLLTQIVSCLLLAIIAGAAIGWLLNGYRAATREKKIKTELMRQSLALSQAETDNKMIEEDYRDLKYRSEDTIAKLADENKQIPVLNQNLEKSQTLVRQMLQNHQAEVRNLSHESEKAKLKLRELENREKAVTRLQMELNTERLQKQGVINSAATDSNVGGDVAGELVGGGDDTNNDTTRDPQQKDIHSDAQQPQAIQEPSVQDQADQQVSALFALKQTQQELAQLHQAELQLEGAHESQANLDSLRKTETRASQVDAVISETAYDELSEVVDSMLDKPAVSSDLDHPDRAVNSNADKLERTAAANQHSGDSQRAKSSENDYGQSNRHDDLQKIFGIGPVTEKTLLSMGITSFEQIANLTTKNIEHVAETLEIFPGRIRRDNWVASARKLLAEEKDGTSHIDSDLHEFEDA